MPHVCIKPSQPSPVFRATNRLSLRVALKSLKSKASHIQSLSLLICLSVISMFVFQGHREALHFSKPQNVTEKIFEAFCLKSNELLCLGLIAKTT